MWIPGSVTSIGSCTFAGCTGLSAIVFYGDAPAVGDNAFYNVADWCRVIVSPEAKGWTIGSTWHGMKVLTSASSVEISNGIMWVYTVENGEASIGRNVAWGDIISGRAISSTTWGAIQIPETLGGYVVTGIKAYAFNCCSNLTSIAFLDTVKRIEGGAFQECTRLRSITIPDGVERVEDCLFAGCTELTSVTLPDSVTEIWEGAFTECTSLETITIPAGVAQIRYGAFSGCSNLSTVIFNGDAPTVEDYAFSGVANGCKAVVDSTKQGWPIGFTCNGLMVVPAVEFTIVDGVLTKAVCNVEGVSVTIPDGVTSIGDQAFAGQGGVVGVTMPNSVTNIGEFAFSACPNLTSVTIPDSVANISITVFWLSESLTDIVLPTNTVIGPSFAQPSGMPYYELKCWSELVRMSQNGTLGENPRYDLSNSAGDRAIATVTVSGDTALDEFVLREGKVYDAVLYITNTAAKSVKLSMPAGNTYKALKGANPLRIPAKSSNILTITRISDDTFLLSREELETID